MLSDLHNYSWKAFMIQAILFLTFIEKFFLIVYTKNSGELGNCWRLKKAGVAWEGFSFTQRKREKKCLSLEETMFLSYLWDMLGKVHKGRASQALLGSWAVLEGITKSTQTRRKEPQESTWMADVLSSKVWGRFQGTELMFPLLASWTKNSDLFFK